MPIYPEAPVVMECTRFSRRSELPGVEVLEVVDSQRPWRRVSSTFELMMVDTWRGQIAYRGARCSIGPGTLFCVGPGDSFEISGATSPGSFRVLMIEREMFERALAKHGLSPEMLNLSRIIPFPPDELLAALVRLLDDLCADSDATRSESSMQTLIGAIATHLGGPANAPSHVPCARVAERVRKLIDAHQEGSLDLAAFSREIGLSRFQVLRAFKRAYSLPPHTYLLCVRIAKAQRLLRLGHRAAYVAAELQFVDQSHLTRHFKRVLRVTPSEYAHAALSKPQRLRRAPARCPSPIAVAV